MVNSEDEHRGVVFGRSTHDYLLHGVSEMGLGLLLGQKESCAFQESGNATLAPRNLGWVWFLVDFDGISIDDQVFVVVSNFSLELSVSRVVFEEID